MTGDGLRYTAVRSREGGSDGRAQASVSSRREAKWAAAQLLTAITRERRRRASLVELVAVHMSTERGRCRQSDSRGRVEVNASSSLEAKWAEAQAQMLVTLARRERASRVELVAVGRRAAETSGPGRRQNRGIQ